MTAQLAVLGAASAVGKECQRPRRRDAGVELAQRTRRRVAWIGEFLFSMRALPAVELLEIGFQHQHFAPHLEPRGWMRPAQPERNRADGAQVGGDVLAGVAVAARRAGRQDAVLVSEADRKAVKLGLDRILHVLRLQCFAHSAVESNDRVVLERIVERQHRRSVRDLGEISPWCGADALGRGVGSDELRILLLEFLQFAEQAVVLGVRNQRTVEHVIMVIVLFDVGAQLVGARRDGVRHSHSVQENRRRARSPPAAI